MRFGVKLALLFILIGLIPLVILGGFSYTRSQQALIDGARRHVLSVSVLKEDELLQWMEGNLALLTSVAARPLVIELSRQLAAAQRGTDEWTRIHDDLVQQHFTPNLTARGLADYHIIHPTTGQVLAATAPANEGKFRESEEFFIEGKLATYVGRVEYNVAAEELVMHVSSPVRADDGTLVAVLAAHINLDEMGRILQLSSGAHVSEDTYVINDFSFFATEPIHGEGYALRRTVHSEGADASLRRESGVAEYADYRGVDVIGAYRWIEPLHLGLLVEVDWADVTAPVSTLRNAIIALGTLVAVAVLIVSALLARGIVRPIRQLIAGTEAIGAGNLQHHIHIRGEGEFAKLSRSFNLMSENLHRVTASRDDLDREVKARTAAELRLNRTISALEESESKFRQLTDASPVSVFIFRDMKLRYVNPRFETVFGYTRTELLGNIGPMEITDPTQHEEIGEYIGNCLAGVADLPPMSFRGIRKDGSTVYCEAMARPIDFEGGPALLGTIVDITQRRLAEAELRLKNTVFESSMAANSIADLSGALTHVNPAFLKLWGYEAKEEVIGLPLSDFMANQDEAIAIVTALNEIGEWEGDFLAVRKDGSTFISNGHATVIRDEAGEMIGYQSANLDVTSQRQADAEIRRSKEITDSIIESIPGVFYQITAEGRFKRWNAAFTEVTGYTDDEMATLSPRDFFQGEDMEHVGAAIANVFETGSGDVTADFCTKAGDRLPYYLTGTLITIDGEATLVGMGTDITALKSIEGKLRRSMDELTRSNQELEQFAYVASHDLQEPLRMVASYTQLLERRYKDALDDDARDFIGYAVDGANRMQRLINDLLDFSRVQTRGKPFERVDLNAVLGHARGNLSAAIDESVAVVTNDELPTLDGDEGQLISVFQNLIGNAVKFRGDEAPRIHIGATDKGGTWEISVRDNGIGINPEFHDRIFVIFQRLHGRDEYAGTGIGLALCKRIVERHGGQIVVDSQPGEGTTFRFTLPKRSKEAR